MKYILVFALQAVFISPFCGVAQTNSHTPFLTLKDAIDAALLNNRTLQIDRINPEIARMTLRASWGYYDPLFLSQAQRQHVDEPGAFDPANPSLETPFNVKSDSINGGFNGFLPSGLTYNINSSYAHNTGSRNLLNFDTYRLGASIFLQQPLLKNSWIDLPRYTIRVNRRRLQISEAGVYLTAMNVINDTQQAYYHLVFAWENLRVVQDLLEARDKFLKSIQRQVELGRLTVLEERVAASHKASVQVTLISASNTLALAANALRTLMGVTGTNWTQDFYLPVDRLAVMPESLDLAMSWQRGLARRPDLLQKMKTVEAADINVKFRRNQLFPSLDIIGSYGRRGASSLQAFPPDKPNASFTTALDQLEGGDAPSDMIGLVLSFPLTRTFDRANYKASKELKRQADLQVEQQKELILRDISDAIFTARFSYDGVGAARRATEFAEAALKAEEEKLAGGNTTVINVLVLQRDLATSQAAEVQAKEEYNRALSQLRFAEGTILDEHHIVLDFE